MQVERTPAADHGRARPGGDAKRLRGASFDEDRVSIGRRPRSAGYGQAPDERRCGGQRADRRRELLASRPHDAGLDHVDRSQLADLRHMRDRRVQPGRGRCLRADPEVRSVQLLLGGRI